MDTMGDMLTRLRNANQRYHKTVSLPTSKLNRAVADILAQEGYVQSVEEKADGPHPTLVIELKYKGKRGKTRVLTGLERVSRLSRRVYTDADHIPDVFHGLGVCILSTSRGVMAGYEARKQRVGGEILCRVW